jgi:predicted nucleic acid-binding protein
MSYTLSLIRTDCVAPELLTLLRIRGKHLRALEIDPRILRGEVCDLEWVTPLDVEEAWNVFSTYQDKGWSVTGCVSRVIMGCLGIAVAFAFGARLCATVLRSGIAVPKKVPVLGATPQLT